MHSLHSQSARPDAVIAIILAIGAIGGGVYLVHDLITNPHYEWDNVLFLMLCLGGAVMALHQAFGRPVYTLYEDGISRKFWFRESFYPKSTLEGYQKKPSDYNGERLIVKTTQGYLTLESSWYTNYEALRDAIVKSNPALADDAFESYEFIQTLPYRFILGAFGVVALVWQIDKLFHPVEDLVKNVATTEVILAGTPEVVMVGSKRKSPEIHFSAVGHPEFVFRMSGESYSATDKDLLRELGAGDTVVIGVERTMLETKLLKTHKPSYWLKHRFWNEVAVYALSHGPKTYLRVENVVAILKKDVWWDVLAWILGTGVLVAVFIRRW
ncbi:MAG: hypothetical protein IT270_06760 [Saprospiraceae bacterium]|nr:hypothetical protein [Saprospiraceae bacterium]